MDYNVCLRHVPDRLSMKDHFSFKAATYEDDKRRVDNVKKIADAIAGRVGLDDTMHLLDFGSGTGLLLGSIAPSVKKITAVDVSPSMMAQLHAKQDSIECELETIQIDLEKESLIQTFDGIISSMTMHHIKDVPAMFDKFYDLVKPGGFVALADLDTEDGSFHTDQETGVHHTGFDRDWFKQALSEAGFVNITIETTNQLVKPQGTYTVFLCTAIKQPQGQ